MLLSLNGRSIRIEGSERPVSEKDPSLFFVHGAGCDASVWARQAGYFRDKRPAYYMDLPGHGGSSPEGEERISAYAQWVRLASSNLFQATPFVLAGHSMGGAIVLDIALNPPPNLAGIVLVATGARLAVTRAIFQMLREDVEAFFRTIGEYAFAPGTPFQIRKDFSRAVRRCPPRVIYNDFRACDTFDIRNSLERIRLPALILCGAMDRLTPPKHGTYLQEKLVSSRLVMVPKAGHMVMAEQPALMNQAIESFLVEIAEHS